jgi:hypothetical protein
MQLRNPAEPKHIHKWQLYTPAIDIELAEYIGVAVEQSLWVYRKCDCKARMRCKAYLVSGYSQECKPYADEGWEPVP